MTYPIIFMFEHIKIEFIYHIVNCALENGISCFSLSKEHDIHVRVCPCTVSSRIEPTEGSDLGSTLW